MTEPLRLLAKHYMNALVTILTEDDLEACHALACNALSTNPAPSDHVQGTADWQPIATVPKHGGKIEVIDANERRSEVYANPEAFRHFNLAYVSWRPLPCTCSADPQPRAAHVEPVAWLRHGEEVPGQNVPFGAMWITDKDDPRGFPVYAGSRPAEDVLGHSAADIVAKIAQIAAAVGWQANEPAMDHHPGYVLIPTAKFEEIRAAIAADQAPATNVTPTQAELLALYNECKSMTGGLGMLHWNYGTEILKRFGAAAPVDQVSGPQRNDLAKVVDGQRSTAEKGDPVDNRHLSAFQKEKSEAPITVERLRPPLDAAMAELIEDLRISASSIREWMPETLPANEQGQIHFARALAESAAEAIEAFLATALDGSADA